MQQGPQRAVAVGTAVAACLLLAAAPTPVRCWRTLTEAAGAAGSSVGSSAGSADPSAPLVALLALVAWGLATWLAATVVLTTGSHLPGRAGRALAAAARRTAPAAVRHSVEVALGLGVVVGTLAGPAAAATPGQEPPPAAAPVISLDWAAKAPAAQAAPSPTAPSPTAPSPTASSPTAPSPAAPDLDWSGAARPAHTPAPDPAGAESVVVRPGDTLWDLAEQDLRERASQAASAQEAGTTDASPTDASPTDAEVAAAWPAWWSANREVVGDDPHLLRPGTPLAPPPAEGPQLG